MANKNREGPFDFIGQLNDARKDVFGAGYDKEGVRGLIPGMGKKELTKEEIAAYKKKRLAKEKREKAAQKKKRQQIKENPSLYKGYKDGGKVRGAGCAQRGVRKAKIL
jgi:hypothetical protein